MWAQVLRIDRLYGGPEEGGWWYDATDVLFERKVTKRIGKKIIRELARQACEDFSGQITLTMPRKRSCDSHGECPSCRPRVIQKGRRNRFSVIGGPDYFIVLSKRRTESTKGRPRYE